MHFLLKNEVPGYLRLLHKQQGVIHFGNLLELLLNDHVESFFLLFLLKEANEQLLEDIDQDHQVVEVDLPEEGGLVVD